MFNLVAGSGTQRAPLLLLLGLVLAEMLWTSWRRRPVYDWRETGASTLIAVGNRFIRPLTGLLLAPIFAYAYAHRLWTISLGGIAGFVLLVLVVDFLYYGYHRASHRVRWLWATHAVHHSSTHFNLSAAYRLGWTELLSGAWLIVLALVWIGVPAQLVAGAFALNLLYQFFLHTQTVGSLGVLEYVLNTPTHHRVHHASNAAVCDRNFGGILIIWDRLFGSFAAAPQDEPLRYGLAGLKASRNPLRILFGEWLRMLADARRAGSLREGLRVLISPP